MPVEKIDIAPVSGVEPQVGRLLEMLDVTTQEWREELGNVSEEALIWQPMAEGHSIGAVILHIADVEAHWIHEVGGGRARLREELDRLHSDDTDQYAGKWPTPPLQTLGWYLRQHDEIRARTRETVRSLNDADHVGARGEQTFTLRWLMHHVMTHEAYHGGQAVLLALMHASRSK